MITGSEEESRELMMNAAIRVVAAHGFEGFTTKRWAAEAGVAEGSLYYHFKSKNDLLDKTFCYIDSKFHAACDQFSVDGSNVDALCRSIDRIWASYFRLLIDNPEWTMYFFRFRSSTRYTGELLKMQRDEYGGFLQAMKLIENQKTGGEDVNWDFILSFILDGITSYAYRVVTGMATFDESSDRAFKKLMMHGILSLL